MSDEYLYLKWIQGLLIDAYRSFSMNTYVNVQLTPHLHQLISQNVDKIFQQVPNCFKTHHLFSLALCLIDNNYIFEISSFMKIREYLSKCQIYFSSLVIGVDIHKTSDLNMIGYHIVVYYLQKNSQKINKNLNGVNLSIYENYYMNQMIKIADFGILNPQLSFTELVGTGQFIAAYFAKNRPSIINLKKIRFGTKLTKFDVNNNWQHLELALNVYHVRRPMSCSLSDKLILLCFVADFIIATKEESALRCESTFIEKPVYQPVEVSVQHQPESEPKESSSPIFNFKFLKIRDIEISAPNKENTRSDILLNQAEITEDLLESLKTPLVPSPIVSPMLPNDQQKIELKSLELSQAIHNDEYNNDDILGQSIPNLSDEGSLINSESSTILKEKNVRHNNKKKKILKVSQAQENSYKCETSESSYEFIPIPKKSHKKQKVEIPLERIGKPKSKSKQSLKHGKLENSNDIVDFHIQIDPRDSLRRKDKKSKNVEIENMNVISIPPKKIAEEKAKIISNNCKGPYTTSTIVVAPILEDENNENDDDDDYVNQILGQIRNRIKPSFPEIKKKNIKSPIKEYIPRSFEDEFSNTDIDPILTLSKNINKYIKQKSDPISVPTVRKEKRRDRQKNHEYIKQEKKHLLITDPLIFDREQPSSGRSVPSEPILDLPSNFEPIPDSDSSLMQKKIIDLPSDPLAQVSNDKEKSDSSSSINNEKEENINQEKENYEKKETFVDLSLPSISDIQSVESSLLPSHNDNEDPSLSNSDSSPPNRTLNKIELNLLSSIQQEEANISFDEHEMDAELQQQIMEETHNVSNSNSSESDNAVTIDPPEIKAYSIVSSSQLPDLDKSSDAYENEAEPIVSNEPKYQHEVTYTVESIDADEFKISSSSQPESEDPEPHHKSSEDSLIENESTQEIEIEIEKENQILSQDKDKEQGAEPLEQVIESDEDLFKSSDESDNTEEDELMRTTDPEIIQRSIAQMTIRNSLENTNDFMELMDDTLQEGPNEISELSDLNLSIKQEELTLTLPSDDEITTQSELSLSDIPKGSTTTLDPPIVSKEAIAESTNQKDTDKSRKRVSFLPEFSVSQSRKSWIESLKQKRREKRKSEKLAMRQEKSGKKKLPSQAHKS